MNVICVNCKEVSAIRPAQCAHCGGQTFEETHAAVCLQDKGTITWFKCAADLPPTTNKTELGHYSDHVLITDGINVDRREFVRTLKEIPIGWMGSNIIGFVPTHWAYINLPK